MKTSEKKYCLIYTILFILLSIGTFFWFRLYGRSLVRNGDAYFQHTKALAFYGKWLRDVVHTIFVEHRLSLPAYSFSMGYGADALTTMHYYVLGDPLNLLAVFVPMEKTAALYSFLIFARMYLAGLVFAYFCRVFGKDDREAVLAGAIMYVFSGYVMYAGVRHPYFINPMIWFPLILAGAEKIRQRRSPALFSVSVCMAAISNFYFFYMIVLLTIMFVLWRCFFVYRKDVAAAAKWVGRLFVCAVTGVLMSAVIFWPVLRLFLFSSRSSSGGEIYALYKMSYYVTIPASFMAYTGPGYWTHLGYTGIGMLAVLMLFMTKKRFTSLKAAFVILGVMILFPFGGYFLNGLIYVLNRWTWAISLLVAFILTAVWEELFTLKIKQFLIMGIIGVLLAADAMLLGYFGKYNSLMQILIAAAAACIMLAASVRPSWRAVMKKLFIGTLCAGIVANGWFAYSERWCKYALEFKTTEEMTRYVTPEEMQEGDKEFGQFVRSDFLNSEAEAVAALEDADTVRYDGHLLTRNASVLNGTHCTQFYWSLANENLDAFMAQMGSRYYLGYFYDGLDDRTGMLTVSGVRYYTTPDGKYIPYGFEKVSSDVNPMDAVWSVYENRNALPLGFTYDAYLTDDEFAVSDALGREDMLMQAVSLEDTEAVEKLGIAKADIEPSLTTLPYEISLGTADEPMEESEETAELLENGIRTWQNNVTVTLMFDGLKNSETYAVFKGLDYSDGKTPFSELSLKEKLGSLLHNTYAAEPDSVRLGLSAGRGDKAPICDKSMDYYTDRHAWYSGRHDFVVNLTYSKQALSYIQITFPAKGVYTWDSLEVTEVLMDGFDARAGALKEDVLNDIDLHQQGEAGLTDLVTGTVSLEEPKILLLSIPHDRGWTAVVDGEKTPILRADEMFMAIPLDAGDHEIELHYRTPGFTAGLIMTLAGLAMLLLLCRRNRKQMRCNTKQEDKRR